jgi:hypothetical protein
MHVLYYYANCSLRFLAYSLSCTSSFSFYNRSLKRLQWIILGNTGTATGDDNRNRKSTTTASNAVTISDASAAPASSSSEDISPSTSIVEGYRSDGDYEDDLSGTFKLSTSSSEDDALYPLDRQLEIELAIELDLERVMEQQRLMLEEQREDLLSIREEMLRDIDFPAVVEEGENHSEEDIDLLSAPEEEVVDKEEGGERVAKEEETPSADVVSAGVSVDISIGGSGSGTSGREDTSS